MITVPVGVLQLERHRHQIDDLLLRLSEVEQAHRDHHGNLSLLLVCSTKIMEVVQSRLHPRTSVIKGRKYLGPGLIAAP